MIAFITLWFLIIAASAIYPTVALRKRQQTNWWDYVYPFTGVAAWFPLGIGSIASLSNVVVEVFWIAALSALLPWARWLLSNPPKEVTKLPFFFTFLPILTAVVVRLIMPTLPE
jgi:hypothetical protein